MKRTDSRSEDDPHRTPRTTDSSNSKIMERSIAKTLYVHSIAFFGSVIAFLGGFLAPQILPIVSEDVSRSETWAYALVGVGALLGLLCAALSYRATLKTYAAK